MFTTVRILSYYYILLSYPSRKMMYKSCWFCGQADSKSLHTTGPEIQQGQKRGSKWLQSFFLRIWDHLKWHQVPYLKKSLHIEVETQFRPHIVCSAFAADFNPQPPKISLVKALVAVSISPTRTRSLGISRKNCCFKASYTNLQLRLRQISYLGSLAT